MVERVCLLELAQCGVVTLPLAEPLAHITSLTVPAVWLDSNRKPAGVVPLARTLCCCPPSLSAKGCDPTHSRGPASRNHAESHPERGRTINGSEEDGGHEHGSPPPTALGYMQACSETGVAAVTSSSRPQLQDSAFQRLRESPAPLPVATAAVTASQLPACPQPS